MPVTTVEKDLDQLTITIVADFTAPLRRLWDAYTDPRQIERFWGPPTYPATFLRHDAVAGGRSVYAMTGPEGDVHYGCWDWTSADAPHTFEVLDRFSDAAGVPNPDLPTTRMDFAFEETSSGSRLTTTSRFDSLEQMQQLIEMGMLEGTREAMAQIDQVLADLASFAAERGAQAQILSDTQVRVARVIRGTVDQVWRAHNDAALMQQWLLGPDGWSMPVCEIATTVGDRYRYEWQRDGGDDRFGFTGELLESEAPYRAVTTEAMIGMDFPPTLNELTLTEVEGGTLLALVITYANAEQRDAVLATGMTDGMETSYRRLEGLLQPTLA
ncbi:MULTISPECIES: SRPBCC family protein [unclassified Cryobacterium]|uniref:SRPBCC family protein n=1 Tax=unclassified Cryobacterium TaxID=2649013 RepID=UPI001069601A|nr:MULTISPECIES: SRPBCC family protein [unclassified Cryobacterium]TFC54497.1 ATPase [Cryobacterium sp. TMB3-1-2]TFC70921.1 ATPase [Cryobacterium sp. TMB3-15]TFC77374.1 ATPase [Cryobacterium sp. TMB3-10]TFD45307.1 ATPase [Cryobacterium sp. TMB3-12]